jgi:hypothetical protein
MLSNFQNFSITNTTLEFTVKFCQNFQNNPLYFRKKKKKLLGFKCWLEFNGICKNTHVWIFETFYKIILKNKHRGILKILTKFNGKS